MAEETKLELESRVVEVALLINRISGSWATLFKHLDLAFEPSAMPDEIFFACPTCFRRKAISFRFNRKGHTLWNCTECRSQKKYFDNWVGLIRFLFKHKHGGAYSPFDIVNLAEDWALEQSAVGELPKEKLTFGQYKNLSLHLVPKNYLKWVVTQCDDCDLEPATREQIRRYLNLPAPIQQQPANIPINF